MGQLMQERPSNSERVSKRAERFLDLVAPRVSSLAGLRVDDADNRLV
jgi:hypothetical protein